MIHNIHKTNIIGLVLILAASLLLTACDNRENVVGQWHFASDTVVEVDGSAPSATSCLVISGDGRVLLTADIEIVQPVSDSASNMVDSVTVKAVASIEGTWRYTPRKNNEIDISYDYSTFGVSIDPDDVIFTPAAGNRHMTAMYDIMKGATIEEYTARLCPGLEGYFNDFSHIGAIRVDNGMMHCSTGAHTYVMRSL